MADMTTPLGITYQPTFPIMESIVKQQQQQEQIRLKEQADARENALTMANAAVADFYKFKDDKRPYVSALEPYFQAKMDKMFEMSQAVRRQELDPQSLQLAMAEYQNDVTEATRKDTIVSTSRETWDKSGIRDLAYLDKKYATYSVDLDSTAQLGTVTLLDPRKWDANQYVNDANLDLQSYNPEAISQKFIDTLMVSEADATLEKDFAGNVINKDSRTLKKKFISDKLGKAGQQTLEFGEINGEQSIGLLNAFRAKGPEFENFLKLRAIADNPNFAQMKEGSDEWGVQMQKSLKNVMQEHGRVPSKPSVSAITPRSEAKDTGTTFNSNFIGGNEKTELQYMTEAKEYIKLFDPDETVRKDALDMFVGKGVSEVAYVASGQAPGGAASENGFVKIKLDKKAEQYNPLMAYAKKDGNPVDEAQGVIYIPLDPKKIKSLSAYANIVRPGDLNPTYLKLALEKLQKEMGTQPASGKKKVQWKTSGTPAAEQQTQAPKKKSLAGMDDE